MCVQSQIGLTALELMSLVDARWSDYLGMLYRAFIDDSADERRQIVMVAGALIGSHEQWRKVRRKWRETLRRSGIRYFRSTEFNSLRGEFAKFRDPIKYPKPKGSLAATALRDQLESILRDHNIMALASSIPLEMFHDVIATYNLLEDFNPDPFAAAMQTVMNESALLVRDEFPGKNNRIAFVCDDGPDSVKLTKIYASFKRKNTNLQDVIGGLVHLDDKKHPPLQAADMVASLGKEITLKHLQSGSPVKLPRMEGVFYKIYPWNRETVKQLASMTILQNMSRNK